MRKNINPVIWGNPGWEFLDAIVAGYPDKANSEEQASMIAFLSSLEHVLPCEVCRTNYSNFAKRVPPFNYVSGQRAVQYWLSAYKQASSPIQQRMAEIFNG